MLTELLILLALVLVNGLFSGAEIAVLTAAKAKLQSGSHRAVAVVSLREQPERFLATVQIGITVVSAAAAAFGGARIAADLAPYLTPVLGGSADEVAMVVVVAFVSFLSLVLGELVPKSLALRYSTGYALFIGRPLLALAQAMRPLVWFLTACSNAVLKIFGDKTSFTESRVSRDELRELVREAAQTGSVDRPAGEIATRAIDFGDVMVAEVMVRRDAILAVPHDVRYEEVQRVLLEEGHTRIPVYEGSLDRIIGYIVARDVLALAWERNRSAVPDIIRPLLYVPATARCGSVLREMQAKHVQIAIVVDEHGVTTGLVTVEDLLEELVGDIFSEDEEPEAMFKPQADGSTLIPGWVPTRKVNRTLHTSLPIAREFTTLAGLCMALALAVPAAGATLTAPDGTVLEVVEASPRRVRWVRVRPRPAPRPEPEPDPDGEARPPAA